MALYELTYTNPNTTPPQTNLVVETFDLPSSPDPVPNFRAALGASGTGGSLKQTTGFDFRLNPG